MSFSFGGQRSTNNQSTGVDPQTAAYMQEVMNAARKAGAGGPSPLLADASKYYTGAMTAGNLGMGAMSGDQASVDALMNPYQRNVIDAANREYDFSGKRAMGAADDLATRSRAFGGSRSGILAGTALADNERARNTGISGLLSQGFSDAMGRAQGLAGMGFSAAGQNANLGFGGVGSPDQWLMEMLRRGYMGPMGSNTSGSSSGVSGSASFNPLMGFM